METIHTLQQFMLHTKNVTYILMVTALIGFVAFWCFLTARDEDEGDHDV